MRIGLAHQRVVVRTLDLPLIEDRKDLDAAVRFQAPDHIPMPMDEAVVDYQDLGAVQTIAGPRTRVVVVAVRRETVDRLISVVRAADLDLVGIDLSAFAMLRALDTVAAAPGGAAEAVLYANVGGLINLAVASGRSCLFTRTAPGGLESLAFTLADQCSLTLDHARQWLKHVGTAAPLEEVAGDAAIVASARGVLLDGARQTADTLRNTLNFYRTQDHAEPVEPRRPDRAGRDRARLRRLRRRGAAPAGADGGRRGRLGARGHRARAPRGGRRPGGSRAPVGAGYAARPMRGLR